MDEGAIGWSGWLALGAMLTGAVFLLRHLGLNLSLSSLLLALLLLFHGPAYLYYTRVWGPSTGFYYHILSAAPGQPVIRNLDLAVALLFVLVPLGMKFADVWFRESGTSVRQAIANWNKGNPGVSTTESSRLRLWLLVVGCGVLVPFVFVDHQFGKISQYLSFDLSASEKIDLRREQGGSAIYLYNLVVATLAPFLAFCALAARVMSKRGWMLAVAGFGGLVILAKMALLSKAPVAIFILQAVMVVAMCKSLQLDARTLYRGLGAALLLFGIGIAIAMPTLTGIGLIGKYMFYRMFMITNEGLVEYFSAIPYVIHFSWGAKMGWLGGLFSGESDLSNVWLVAQVHREAIGSTTAVLFVGDAWADWAWYGIIAAPFMLGFMVRALDIALICRRGRSVAVIGALGLGQFGISVAMHTALQTTMLTGGLIMVLPLCYALSGRRTGGAGVPGVSARAASDIGALQG